MKDKVIGCRVTQECYEQLCEIGVPSNILREGLELFFNSNKNPRKRSVNGICFDCRYNLLCELVDRHLNAKKDGDQ